MDPTDPQRDTTPADPRRPEQREIATVKPSRAGDASPTSAERFPAGTLLSERYRIVGRLGRGGMGEVYRADDLKLGQSVALKFLPPTADESRVRRFHDEVRIAREVSHPNVCRTYDIGEVDGERFISMEYVDGEDLSVLLRRIGRLPKDKAIEIARELCAGLAAAHDKDVLHRDLKPANVMLDGRGRVRITDFGIAALAEEIGSQDAGAGTPFYMAPEQLDGKSASIRSDIFSLGLVLYEVFTGKEAYHADSLAQLKQLRRSSIPSTPSSFVEDMDPTVERVIMRCLERDPAERPGSAIAVAAALPGGDPLAMALAAGETPSPQMVAEAGERGGLRPALALSCLAAVIVMLVVGVLAFETMRLERFVHADLAPAVLAHRAREIALALGYDEEPADTDYSFEVQRSAMSWIDENDAEPGRWERAAASDVDLLHFHWRSSPRSMSPQRNAGRVSDDDPLFTVPGMIRLGLDPRGRLLHFEAVPERAEPGTRSPAAGSSALDAAPDFSPLLEATGLDPATLEAAEPVLTPPCAFDTRTAWRWTGAGSETYPLRIEAAAWRGRVVWLESVRPWNDPATDTASSSAPPFAVFLLFTTMFLAVTLGGALVAIHNLRAGRGDRRGAFRLALFFFFASLGTWLFQSDRLVDLEDMPFAPATRAFALAASLAVIMWLLYLAIEPFARRYWPRTIVSWTRLLGGRWRDPLVGRDVLLGVVAGSLFALLLHAQGIVSTWVGLPMPVPQQIGLDAALSGRHAIGELFGAVAGLNFPIGFFVLILLLRILLRRTWLAVVGFGLIMGSFFALVSESPVDLVRDLMIIVLITFIAVRFGLLALAALFLTLNLATGFPITLDMSAWYASTGLVGGAAVLAVAGYGFWIALAGQPIFREREA